MVLLRYRKSLTIFLAVKSFVPTIINGTSVISFSPDKAEHFALNFASKSTLDDQGHPLSDFPALIDHKLRDLIISAREVSRLIQNIDSLKGY